MLSIGNNIWRDPRRGRGDERLVRPEVVQTQHGVFRPARGRPVQVVQGVGERDCWAALQEAIHGEELDGAVDAGRPCGDGGERGRCGGVQVQKLAPPSLVPWMA